MTTEANRGKASRFGSPSTAGAAEAPRGVWTEEGGEGGASAPNGARQRAAAGGKEAGDGRPVYRIRPPAPDEGALMWRIARETGVLEANSPYAYVMVARLFAAASRIAEADGRPVGFIAGLALPERDGLFVWQIGVRPAHQGNGLGGRMLEALVFGRARPPVRRLWATVAEGNRASWRLFQGVAERSGGRFRALDVWPPFLFAVGDGAPPHPPEILIEIAWPAEALAL
ncbi:MAG: L-2,4-diaminobutyric acid acetyltransferase [Hydrogenibacillus schlegelii]|uniref:L-2,4-diaminobutyric acid acetyltransferase n=1 Tax=Hydrogenibacillus schlegelii TaxID=1484 RepID=A0A2T5G983_HYDSH|nr:MAG: L-2,4-diaminobutyric acid acetyltransferase [Hydrogenibacillus schlegelii]